VFLANYTKALRENGMPGIYINYSIDALCFDRETSSFEDLRQLHKQHPAFMTRLQWIELPTNNSLLDFNELVITLDRMRSLKLIILRWLSDPRPNPQVIGSWPWSQIDDAIDRIARLRSVISMMENSSKPILAILLPPEQINMNDFQHIWQGFSTLDRHFDFHVDFKTPSEEVLDRFEVDIPEEWISLWPGGKSLISHGWCAHEVLQKSVSRKTVPHASIWL
jgi:hypothetical protein